NAHTSSMTVRRQPPPASTPFPYTTLFRSRLYCKVLRQAGSNFSQSYMEETLARHAPIARRLVRLFERRVCDQQYRWHDTRCRQRDRKSTRLNSSHVSISYVVFCLK